MAEYRAIRSVIGHDGLRMNSTKSMIGHLLGGAGAVEAVATIKAIQTGERGFMRGHFFAACNAFPDVRHLLLIGAW
jgi:3-oxoacyl-(acyl-carrier-protein) synthase